MSYPFHTKRCKSWFINPELDFTSWILNTESLRELHEGQISSLFSEAPFFNSFFFIPNQELDMFCTLLFSWSFCTRSCILSAFYCYALKNLKRSSDTIWMMGGRKEWSRNSQNNNSPLFWINLSDIPFPSPSLHLMKDLPTSWFFEVMSVFQTVIAHPTLLWPLSAHKGPKSVGPHYSEMDDNHSSVSTGK